MFEMISGYGVWHRRYFVLEGCIMHYWNHPNDKETKVQWGQPGRPRVTTLNKNSFNCVLCEPLRKQRAACLCPAPPAGASGPWRGTRALDLSPSSWWATSRSSSRTPARTPWPSKLVKWKYTTLRALSFVLRLLSRLLMHTVSDQLLSSSLKLHILAYIE